MKFYFKVFPNLEFSLKLAVGSGVVSVVAMEGRLVVVSRGMTVVVTGSISLNL